MGKTVAFIPVRGGSKSIPLKNIKELCGKPLVYWTAKAACESENIDDVYIATDSAEIRNAVENFCISGQDSFAKIHIIDRAEENASDTATTEAVMLEFAEKYDFENIILVQATSPLIRAVDIDEGFSVFMEPETDSVISLVQQKRFLWTVNGDEVKAANYDPYNRPRRQDFDPYLMENGAFYITSKEALLKSRNRISGHIRASIMPEETAIEIDEPNDFLIVEKILEKRIKAERMSNKPAIKMVVTDCDGCLTDGGMYYSENGDELKKFNTKDGLALKRLHDKGIITGIITGEDRELNRRRAKKLDMDFIESGVKDKAKVLSELCKRYNVGFQEVLYIGDDINDYDAMRISGISACPADAASHVKEIADYVSISIGGDGAVREILEIFLNI